MNISTAMTSAIESPLIALSALLVIIPDLMRSAVSNANENRNRRPDWPRQSRTTPREMDGG